MPGFAGGTPWIRTPPWSATGHRDYNDTECPGDVFYARLPDLRDRVAEAMAA